MLMLKFPSINQFSSAVKHVRDNCNYHGSPLPVLKFRGTVKLHGTNAGVACGINTPDQPWAQSRENVISLEKDNAGFAAFVHTWKADFTKLLERVIACSTLEGTTSAAIYGEWCGRGVQKGVGISQVEPKRFVIFAAKTYNADAETSQWLTPEELRDLPVNSTHFRDDLLILTSEMFQAWDIEIDFKSPALVQNDLVAITNAVEAECPVAKAFGVSGIGEGVVWRCVTEHPTLKHEELVFKVKGAKHSETKVKTTAEVDVEVIKDIEALAEAITTEHRLEKKLDDLREAGFDVDVKNTGKYLEIVSRDVIKEESERIVASGHLHKVVMPAVTRIARQYFLEKARLV